MIPKKIHYCWFGGKELPDFAKKCIESWKKYCPDYEIIEWNETNFDINMNDYVKEAYKKKKWAFVSDVARLYALYTCGGVYMDTDVEVTKNIDKFLENEAFSGFESYDSIPTGIMACTKNNKLFKKLLDYYSDKHFINEDGSLNMTTNVEIITNELTDKGLVRNNTYQVIDGFALYPFDYFCPLDYSTKKLRISDNTHTIHWFNGSWITPSMRIKAKIKGFIVKIIGKKNSEKIKKICKKRRGN